MLERKAIAYPLVEVRLAEAQVAHIRPVLLELPEAMAPMCHACDHLPSNLPILVAEAEVLASLCILVTNTADSQAIVRRLRATSWAESSQPQRQHDNVTSAALPSHGRQD